MLSKSNFSYLMYFIPSNSIQIKNDIIELHINIRSFNANFSYMSCLIYQLGKSIDIIAMSET